MKIVDRNQSASIEVNSTNILTKTPNESKKNYKNIFAGRNFKNELKESQSQSTNKR